MHLDFANALNLVSTVTLIGALVFTGLQVRVANRTRREQAAVTVIQTTALSENSARIMELLGQIPQNASAVTIDDLDAEAKRQILQFGLRLEITGYMVSRRNGRSANCQRPRWWRDSRFLVAREKLVGRKTEAHRRGRVPGMVSMACDADRTLPRDAALCSGVLTFAEITKAAGTRNWNQHENSRNFCGSDVVQPVLCPNAKCG